MKYILGVLLAFFMAYLIMPMLMKLAIKIGFTDKPTKRKQHRAPIPLCGGVGMYIAFFSIYFLLRVQRFDFQLAVFIASTLILGIGLVDDHYKSVGKEFPIYPRFAVQILAAFIVYKNGVVFTGFDNPFTNTYIFLPEWLQLILTITWIFGVTTVINWSDGMDGLAGGISLVSCFTFFFAAIILGQEWSALTCCVLGGAILGFLKFNKHPAQIFMGDSGANLIGFLLSIIALDGAFKSTTVMSLFIPILALAVPIFDNLFVIYKRFREGKPVYQADRSQMHFRLKERGMSTNQVVSYIILISLVCSLTSIVLLLLKR
ncbi:MAG: MraY family glycosyltransferase [Clostridium sp.]|nr:undecaprenyl/decaprenyl-phosphate alpha-N-acetylglucosaminyl 1-phosphate transferase [Clostridium sp.]